MASYGLLGVEPEQPTPREQGRFARGRDAGHYFARQMAAKHGENNVIAEMAVPWPAPPALPVGELHIDVGLLSDRIAIEAKSSKWIDSMFDSAVLQVAGAVHFSEHFDSGLVVFLDGDYQITHEFPVFLTDELIEQVESIAAAVIEAGQGGFPSLPPRVCEKPSDARSHLCPFADTCFQGWEAPQAAESPELSQLASEGWLIQRDLRAQRGDVKELEAKWEAWKERAIAAEVPTGETMAGSIRIKRVDVRGKETFSRAKAATAGVWQSIHDEIFHPFIKISDGYSTFDLKRTEADGGGLDLDFGDASHLDDV